MHIIWNSRRGDQARRPFSFNATNLYYFENSLIEHRAHQLFIIIIERHTLAVTLHWISRLQADTAGRRVVRMSWGVSATVPESVIYVIAYARIRAFSPHRPHFEYWYSCIVSIIPSSRAEALRQPTAFISPPPRVLEHYSLSALAYCPSGHDEAAEHYIYTSLPIADIRYAY
jgi:hypothetical protein